MTNHCKEYNNLLQEHHIYDDTLIESWWTEF